MSTTSDTSENANSAVTGSDASILHDPSPRSLQMLAQNEDIVEAWVCQNMDIVDACQGTSVSDSYRGNFVLYTEPCEGDFVPGLPIYKSTDRPTEPLFIYPLDIYPDNWSVADLRGLVRWRIVSFKNFDDRTSCRIETANIYHIEFAADGQPYNYFPTIYCFDEEGSDFSGFKSSTINIRCNDESSSPPPPGGGSGSDSDAGGGGGNAGSDTDGGGSAGVAIAIIVVLLVLGGVGYYFWKRHNDRQRKDPKYSRSNSKDSFNDENDIYPMDDYGDVERAPPPIDGPSQHRPSLMERIKSFATPLPPVEDDPMEDVMFMDEGYRGSPPDKSYEKVRRTRTQAPGTSNASDGTADTQPTKYDQPDVGFYNGNEKPSSPRGGSRQEPDKALSDASEDEVSELAPSSFDDPDKQDPDKDLSLRSMFKEIRSRWSDRSRALGREPPNGSHQPHKASTSDNVKQGISSSAKVDSDRARSMERWMAANDANRNRSRSRERSSSTDYAGNERSDSKERPGASGFADSKNARRSTSAERSKSSNYADRSRSQSKERSVADEYQANRNRSRSREKSGATDYAGNQRPQSKERSGASGFTENTRRSTSTERSKSSNHADRSRSLSKERSEADGYAKRSRSSSKERSGSSTHAEKNRSSSKERSDADKFIQASKTHSKELAAAGNNATRNRSTSKERSNASSHADGSRSRSKERLGSSGHSDDNRRRTNSAERSSALANAVMMPSNNRSVNDPVPRSRHPSGHGRTVDFGETTGRKGRGVLDASKAGESITKNPDGSVIVSKKRTREDGAIVTTNTKYASVALARSHGVDV